MPMLLQSGIQEEMGLFLLLIFVAPACDSKNLSSHFVTMRESAKDKTSLLRVAEKKDQSNPGL